MCSKLVIWCHLPIGPIALPLAGFSPPNKNSFQTLDSWSSGWFFCGTQQISGIFRLVNYDELLWFSQKMNQPSLHISTISSALVGTATTGVFPPSTLEKMTYCCHDLFRNRFHDFLIWQKEIKQIQENASKSMKQWTYRPFGYCSWEFPDQSGGLARWENHWTIAGGFFSKP